MLLRDVLASAVVVTMFSVAALPLTAATALEDSPTQASVDEATIAKRIKQLDSNRFAERNEASSSLEAAGKAALPALSKAALGDSREVTLRAIDI